MPDLQFYPAGDCALVAEFGREIDETINDRVHHLANWVRSRHIRGVTEVLPTFRSLMVFYEPEKISYKRLVRILSRTSAAAPETEQKEAVIHQIPVVYDGQDLEDMEALTGLSRDAIIAIHSGTDYKIHMMGFLPGFVYLGGLDPRICVPRLDTPRTKIDAGSVGIGGNQTGVYPVASPGGWRILGHTPLKFYDPARPQPFLCQAGEYIRFIPVPNDAAAWEAAK